MSQSSYSVQTSDSVTMTCVISANPSATSVTWYRVASAGLEAIVVGSSSKYSGGSVTSPSLTISNTVDSDGGTYRCTATNAVGTGSSADVILDVVGSEWENQNLGKTSVLTKSDEMQIQPNNLKDHPSC